MFRPLTACAEPAVLHTATVVHAFDQHDADHYKQLTGAGGVAYNVRASSAAMPHRIVVRPQSNRPDAPGNDTTTHSPALLFAAATIFAMMQSVKKNIKINPISAAGEAPFTSITTAAVEPSSTATPAVFRTICLGESITQEVHPLFQATRHATLLR